MERFARFVATERGFASALHSGDPAHQPLPDYFFCTLAPRVQGILDAGAREGSIRHDVRADDLIHALSRLAQEESGASADQTTMTDVLLDGLFVQR